MQVPDTKATTAFMRIIAANGDVEMMPIVIVDNVAHINKQLPLGVYVIEVLTDQKTYSAQLLVE